VAYAYAVPPQALVWPTVAADPDVQLIPAILRDRLPPPIVRHSECRTYLRRALAAEIGLVGRFETGTVRQWALTVDAATTHLRDTVSSRPQDDPALRKAREGVYADNVDMARFARFLSFHAGEPVFDRTGLTDRYNFNFVWEAVPDDAPDRREREFQAIRAAIQPWWGLVLEPTESEMTRLVVERAEPPLVPVSSRR
jgi:uncharacterized protein (TIGR03435 family)